MNEKGGVREGGGRKGGEKDEQGRASVAQKCCSSQTFSRVKSTSPVSCTCNVYAGKNFNANVVLSGGTNMFVGFLGTG